MPFLETSAKASVNVDEAFVTMTKEIKEKSTVGTGKTANTPSAAIGKGK